MSSGNILITDKGPGILIDWDQSKKVIRDFDASGGSSQPTYSCVVWFPSPHRLPLDKLIYFMSQGTLAFISIARIVDPWTKPHKVSNDLESFFWVLLYQRAKYLNTTEMPLSTDIRHVFNQHPHYEDIWRALKESLTASKTRNFSLP